MKRMVVIAALALAGACGDNHSAPPEDGAAPPVDAAVDAAVDAPPGVTACALDLPGVLARPPAGTLPCELLPPGFVAPR